jgi:hypothetical protein
MFSKVFKYFEPLTAVLSSFSIFKVLLLLVLFLSPATVAHCFDLSFAWDANTEPDLAGYRVFYREEGQNYDYNNPDWEGTETTCTIYDLDDNAIYYFVSRAYDIYGNESENSVELSSADSGGTIITSSHGDGDGGGGGGCFIATAAFGSIIESRVKLLRQFRDRFLLTNTPGKTFVRLYYAYSPPLADVISAHESLRMIVRWSLAPLIGLSWMLLHLGVGPALLMLSLMGSVVWKSYEKIQRCRTTARE